MNARALGVVCLLVVVSASSAARAGGDCRELAPWSRAGRSLEEFAEPVPLVLAGVSPLPLVAFAPTGLDHELRVVAQSELGGRYKLEPVTVVVPYALAGSAFVGWGVGALAGACDVERPLAAIVQGMAGGLLVTGVLKWGVGREWPNAGRDPRAPDRLSHPEYARRFRPFGRLGAWPSGHTLSMVAAAAAFRAADPELGWVRFAGYPLALGVAAGMWFGDRHWASDIVSGALLGEALGGSVGRAFAPSEDPQASGWVPGTLVVVPLEGGMLATWLGPF